MRAKAPFGEGLPRGEGTPAPPVGQLDNVDLEAADLATLERIGLLAVCLRRRADSVTVQAAVEDESVNWE